MIPFTQYLRPNGRKTPVEVERPSEVESKAFALIEKGYVFECEQLTTGDVALTLYDPHEELDVGIRVVSNGPAVLEAVDELVIEMHERFINS